jgi:hypothetical protein
MPPGLLLRKTRSEGNKTERMHLVKNVVEGVETGRLGVWRWQRGMASFFSFSHAEEETTPSWEVRSRKDPGRLVLRVEKKVNRIRKRNRGQVNGRMGVGG